jgi:hypothetical protein
MMSVIIVHNIMIELVRNESNDSPSCLPSPPSGTKPFLPTKKDIKVTKLTIMHGVLPVLMHLYALDNRRLFIGWGRPTATASPGNPSSRRLMS